jgi:hypothetical protein
MNFLDTYLIEIIKCKISRESLSCGLRYSMYNYEATDGEIDSRTDDAANSLFSQFGGLVQKCHIYPRNQTAPIRTVQNYLHCYPTTLSIILSHNMSSGELVHCLLISVQAQCHHTSCSSNSTSPLPWTLWSPSRCSELQTDCNRPATNSPISSLTVLSEPAHFSLLKLVCCVMWRSHYEGLHWGPLWRYLSRRKEILPSKR